MFDDFLERRTFNEFEDERGYAAGFFESVDGCDVGMVQCCEQLCLAAEARQPIRVVRDAFGQDLERDVAIQAGVAGAIDLAHAPSAK